MGWYETDISGVEALQAAMEEYEGAAGPLIDEVLHGEGADYIKSEIAMLIPSSGRHWKGKAAPASAAMPAHFSQDNGTLSVTIAARGRYGYLYFPDDGSNSMRHQGDQGFMQRGAENATSKIIDLCVGRLVDAF